MRWLSMALKRTGQDERARSLWEEMLSWPYKKDVFPYIELAKYHEHRLKDCETAISYVSQALEQIQPDRRKEIDLLLLRRERLEHKKMLNASR